MREGKDILTNDAIYSTFKHRDPLTTCGRFSLKDRGVNERIFRNKSFRKLKIAKESNHLKPNQKSNELSMSRKCQQSVTTETEEYLRNF